MQPITVPDVHELLPPILACLPTAFLSPRPPPALLPLLSPILRQRLHLLAPSSATPPPQAQASRGSNWLRFLTWSPQRAERLQEIVGNLHLEPHPVSGEIELFTEDEEPQILYRRRDSETLQAKCNVPQYELAVVWVWCTNDTGGVGLEAATATEVKSGWRVTEVLPIDGDAEEIQENPSMRWVDSMQEADEIEAQDGSLPPRPTIQTNNGRAESENDDDYWAMYDRTPGRTPGLPSPAPGRPSPGRPSPGLGANQRSPGLAPLQRTESADERAYYEQYGSVQPAMDNYDPDEAEVAREMAPEEMPVEERHTDSPQLQPRALHGRMPSEAEQYYASSGPNSYPYMNGHMTDAEKSHRMSGVPLTNEPPRIHSPTPSHGSSGSSPVAALEASASTATAAEIGVKQHISTEMKSLWRLAKAAGIDRSEFERVIRTELDLVGLIDELSGEES